MKDFNLKDILNESMKMVELIGADFCKEDNKIGFTIVEGDKVVPINNLSDLVNYFDKREVEDEVTDKEVEFSDSAFDSAENDEYKLKDKNCPFTPPIVYNGKDYVPVKLKSPIKTGDKVKVTHGMFKGFNDNKNLEVVDITGEGVAWIKVVGDIFENHFRCHIDEIEKVEEKLVYPIVREWRNVIGEFSEFNKFGDCKNNRKLTIYKDKIIYSLKNIRTIELDVSEKEMKLITDYVLENGIDHIMEGLLNKIMEIQSCHADIIKIETELKTKRELLKSKEDLVDSMSDTLHVLFSKLK